jgi:hypothetical protein
MAHRQAAVNSFVAVMSELQKHADYAARRGRKDWKLAQKNGRISFA